MRKPAGRRGLRVCAQMRQTRGRAPSYPNANMRFMFDYLHGKINKRISTAAGAAFLERPRHPGARPVRCRRHAHSGRVLNQRSEGGRQNAVPRFGLVSGGELFHRNFPRVLRAVMGSEPWSLPPVAALGSASVRTNLVAKYCCSFTPTALCCPEPWGEFARRSRLIRKSLAGILGSFSMATRPSVDGLQASTLGYGLSASITVIREFLSVVRSAKLSADSALYR
jgi:hypothetical protein